MMLARLLLVGFLFLVPVLEGGRTEARPRCFTALVILVLAPASLNSEAEKIINANAWQLVSTPTEGRVNNGYDSTESQPK